MTDACCFPSLRGDPELSKVAAVILDEFHERSLALELGLAWAQGPPTKIQAGFTASGDERHLGFGSSVAVFRRLSHPPQPGPGFFPVTGGISPPARTVPDLGLKVKTAVKTIGRQRIRHDLSFLPGMFEIQKCREALRSEPLEVHALYGDLSVEEQQKVSKPQRRDARSFYPPMWPKLR